MRVQVLEQAGPIVYRLGHDPFKVERRVRLPLGLCVPEGGIDGSFFGKGWDRGA